MNHDESPEQRCAIRSLALQEPLAGTAGPATAYLAVEQGGAWGRDAVAENALDNAITAELGHLCNKHSVKPLIIHRPGRTADRSHAEGRTVFAATVAPARLLVKLTVTDPLELLHLDWEAFHSGDLRRLHPTAVIISEPLALICTHAKRDRCCAIEGRPIAAGLQQRHPGLSWECSHLGGHRFAPTALMLPLGAVYGRLDNDRANEIYDAARADRVVPELLRGLSRYQRAVQAADIEVRTTYGLVGIDDLQCTDVHADGDTTKIRYGAVDGRHFTCTVETARLEPARLESCGKDDAHPLSYAVTDVAPHVRKVPKQTRQRS